MSKLNKFYLKTSLERIKILKELGEIESLDIPKFDDEKADFVIENHLFNFQIPLGVALNFKVNDKKYIVPMATEEPSVIAAASNGAKTLGNIRAYCETKHIIGQIVLYNINNVDLAILNLEKNISKIKEKIDEMTTSMLKRGGGFKNIWIDKFVGSQDYLSLYISVDTVDAMGANTINSILENISGFIETITESKFLMRIISNNSIESIVMAKAKINVSVLDKNIENAREIAKRIHLASEYAHLDKFRAVTHNKGIMNGIDAVLIATGNDFRAIESSSHSYAVKNGSYVSLTNWIYDESNGILEGSIEIPMQVATVGGTISVNPMAKWSLELLGNPSSKELAMIIASVGLAQNFSALRAIVSVGIQKGHMALHARSVALEAGAEKYEVEKVVEILKNSKINIENAKKAVERIRNK